MAEVEEGVFGCIDELLSLIVTVLVLKSEKMASFTLPPNMQESGRIWGPSTSAVSEQFQECVYLGLRQLWLYLALMLSFFLTLDLRYIGI